MTRPRSFFYPRRLGAVLVALVWVLVGACPARAECSDENLLLRRPPHASRGTAHPERLSDGLLAREGDDVSVPAATLMKGLRPFVEWDLGAETPFVAAAIQADNNDTYAISTSIDGRAYAPLWVAGPESGPGLRERVKADLAGVARYVRFEALSGDQTYAAAEVRVYCRLPSPWPPSRVVRESPPRDLDRIGNEQAQSLALVFGVAALPLLFLVFPRLRPRAQKRLAALVILLAALSWIQFGRFIAGSPLHYWDMFHYFMGSKYFPETGYFDLYRCAAKAERELGNGALVDKVTIRDLETNDLYPGDFTRTAGGACRGNFSPERFQEMKEDLKTFQGLFTGHTLPEAFSDHGFNATPPNVAWLGLWTRHAPASRVRLEWLAQLDSLSLAGAIAAVWWGFGPFAAAVSAVTLGVGSFWCFPWVGGSLARHGWLLWCVLGFALLARGRHAGAGAALTASALLRLFPFGFVGGVLVWVLVRAAAARKLDGAGKRFLAGVAISFALGNALTASAVGSHTYRDFARVFDRHSHTPSANQLGLTTLLSYTESETDTQFVDPKLTDPNEPWTHHQLERRAGRRPIWAACVLSALAIVVVTALRGGTAVECAAVSGLLVFCLLPMTSYDYTWLVVLVALAPRRPHLAKALVAFAVGTYALLLFGGEESMMGQHLIGSAACGALLLYAADVRGVVAWLLERIPKADPVS